MENRTFDRGDRGNSVCCIFNCERNYLDADAISRTIATDYHCCKNFLKSKKVIKTHPERGEFFYGI